jgi:hypothetical protein
VGVKKIFLVLVILFTSIAQAEYRVFILLLSNKKNASTRQIQTTLDPEQYKTLYPLNEGETLTYVDTWMCRGRTDNFNPHCDKPVKQAPVAASPDQTGRQPANSPVDGTTKSPDIKN